ncbi:MAG: prenyltransferase/squalene oxidase repeat-containing protein [Chloroflexota bacterium]|nr:hypothetical protein [Anaerolineae bacterium]
MKNVRLLKIVSLALIASLIFLSVPITAQQPATVDFADQVAAVEAALAWLKTQQQVDGSFQAAFGSTTGATIDALFAIVASGGNPRAWSVAEGPSIIDYLAAQATVYTADSTATAAKLALAAISADENPSAFGGLDLPAIVAASYDAGTGRYGLGLADQMWAMLAEAALRQEVPQAAADWLAAQQQADGGFDAAGWGTDTDTTSLAIEALVAARQPITCTVVISGLNYLKSQQSPTGGFPSTNVWGPDSNANSTAYSMQGLLAAGENPLGARWTVNGATPLDDLLSFQSPSGAFEWQSGFGEDIVATAQSITALTGRPLPLQGQRLAAMRGLEWLRGQQSDDGGFGTPDLTSRAILAIAAAGEEPSTWMSGTRLSPLDYLESKVNELDTAGKAGRMLQAITASYGNPYNFGGRNLIDALTSFYDPVTGRFDSEGNIWEHALAMMGLAAAWETVPTEAIVWLKTQQNGDGGWGWAAGFDSDTNSTSLSLQALVAAGEPSDSVVILNALAYLAGQQNSDGGFPWVKPSPWGTDSDSNSTAIVTQSLLAAGANPASITWTRTLTETDAITMTWHTAYDRLVSFQTSSGAFEWQDGTGDDLLSTVQAIPALLGVTFPQRAANLQAVQDALAWLRTQQQPDGSFLTGSSHNAGITSDVVFAVAAAGGDPSEWSVPEGSSMMDYLESTAVEYATVTDTTSKLILAAICGGRDPADFGGLDLPAQLSASYDQGTGLYGLGLSDQVWAFLALKALAQPIPTVARDWLANQQQANGGFDAWGYGADTETTALAIEALVAAGEPISSEIIGDALNYLASQQSPTGGFPSSSIWETDSNANSTAYCMQALAAAGENPLGARWTVTNTNPMDDLLGFQAASGALEWQHGSGDDVLATAQAIPALLSQPLPVCSVVWRVFMPLSTKACVVP